MLSSRLDMDGNTLRRRVRVFAAAASLNSVSLGVSIGLVSTVSPLVKKSLGLSTLQLEVYQASLSFFAIFGAAAASLLLDPFGRRAAFMVASALFITGAIIEACAQNFGMLMVGIAFVGCGCGYGLAIDPIYIAEFAETGSRGFYVTWSECAICAGQVLGFVVGLAVDTLVSSSSLSWRIMCLCGTASPIALLVAVALVLPESPRWLAVNGRAYEATEVLVEAVGISRTAADQLVDDVLNDHSLVEVEKTSWTDLMFSPNPAVRLMTQVGVGVAMAQQLSGIDPILFEFTFIVSDLGISSTSMAYLLLVVLGLLKLGTALIAACFLDDIGRRPLLVGSAAVCTVCLVAAAFSVHAASVLVVLLVIYAFIVAFEAGLGPGAWLVPSEVYYNKIRLPAMGMATTSNRIATTVLVCTAITVKNAFGWKGFFATYAVTCAASLAFLVAYLPETAGRSLEDMYDYFVTIARKPSADASLTKPLL